MLALVRIIQVLDCPACKLISPVHVQSTHQRALHTPQHRQLTRQPPQPTHPRPQLTHRLAHSTALHRLSIPLHRQHTALPLPSTLPRALPTVLHHRSTHQPRQHTRRPARHTRPAPQHTHPRRHSPGRAPQAVGSSSSAPPGRQVTLQGRHHPRPHPSDRVGDPERSQLYNAAEEHSVMADYGHGTYHLWDWVWLAHGQLAPALQPTRSPGILQGRQHPRLHQTEKKDVRLPEPKKGESGAS